MQIPILADTQKANKQITIVDEDLRMGRVLNYSDGGFQRNGNAGAYLCPLDALAPGSAVVLVARVSTRGQGRKGTLLDSMAYLTEVALSKGLVVAAVVTHTGSGVHPDWLVPAVRVAKEYGAVLLAEAPDRYLRSASYHSADNPSAQPTEEEWANLMELAQGVGLYTVVSPDASNGDMRAAQTVRGMVARNKKTKDKAPPGSVKRRRIALLPEVLLRALEHVPTGRIAKELGLPHTTVRRWVAKWMVV